jgi:hypothetical protein
MGLSSSVDAQYGAAFRVDHIVDPAAARARPAHAIGGATAPLFQTRIELAARRAPTDRVDRLAQRHKAPLSDALAHFVLLRGPASAKGIAFPADARRRTPEGLRLRRATERLALRRAAERLALRRTPLFAPLRKAARLTASTAAPAALMTAATATMPPLRANRRGEGCQHKADNEGGHRFHKPFLDQPR